MLVLDSPPAPGGLTRINQVLAALGLGALTPASTTTVPGRNHNRAGVTDRGIGVFVKHIGGIPDAAARLRRIIAIEAALRHTRHDDLLLRPRCLGWDEASGLIVFELLRPARSGARLAETGAFDDDLAARAGRLVATLHDSPAMARCADPVAPPFPATRALESLSWHELRTATGAELELWRILQQDRDLGAAVRGLRGGAHPTSPAHCDLRLDQFQLSSGRLYLSDWEELRLADPARDVGAFAGEWLFRSITEPAGTPDAGPSHEDILERTVLAFERVRPLITAFWRGYLATRVEPDAGLPCRATAFAGWHQFDRLFAVAAERPRLGPVERAVAGIARRALLAPGEFAAALGLGEHALTAAGRDRLAAALDTVTLDAGRLTAVAGGHRVTAGSIAALRGELSRVLYDALHAGRRPDAGTRPEPDAALERRLTGAVPHTTTRVPVRLVAAAGDALVVELDGVRVRIPATALDPARRQAFGHLVLVEAGCLRPRLSPGHLLVDGSRGNGLARGAVLRVYLHLTDAEAAVASWRWTLECLERLRVPYRAKIVSAGSSLPRRDAMVVYLGPDAWRAAGAIGAGLPDHPGRGREVSPFTHPLAPGVSVAWEPTDDRTGQRGLSFGLHRSLAVATGLVDHATGAVAADRDRAVFDALIAAGIDPARPFRNTCSPPLPTT